MSHPKNEAVDANGLLDPREAEQFLLINGPLNSPRDVSVHAATYACFENSLMPPIFTRARILDLDTSRPKWYVWGRGYLRNSGRVYPARDRH